MRTSRLIPVMAAAVLVFAGCSTSPATSAPTAGVTEVAFDRSGFSYHGRVKALAEAAREGGLKF